MPTRFSGHGNRLSHQVGQPNSVALSFNHAPLKFLASVNRGLDGLKAL